MKPPLGSASGRPWRRILRAEVTSSAFGGIGTVSESGSAVGVDRERRRESQSRYARIMVAERDFPMALEVETLVSSSSQLVCLPYCGDYVWRILVALGRRKNIVSELGFLFGIAVIGVLCETVLWACVEAIPALRLQTAVGFHVAIRVQAHWKGECQDMDGWIRSVGTSGEASEILHHCMQVE